MRIFQLAFVDDGKGASKIIEFQGFHPDLAFALLEKETDLRKATLWEGKSRLAVLTRDERGYWELSD